MKFLFLFLLSAFSAYCQTLSIDTLYKLPKVSFRSIELSKNKILVSGSKGTVLLSEDSGLNWKKVLDTSFQKFDFRAAQFIKKDKALIMSAGPAQEGKAKVYFIDFKGNSQLSFEDTQTDAFFDALHFDQKRYVYLLGDPLNSKPYLKRFDLRKQKWDSLSVERETLQGEASYAASNSSILTHKKKIWFCTQNRIFYSTNRAKTWTVFNTPFSNGNMQGIYALGLTQHKGLLAVGGDYNGKEEALQFAKSDFDAQKWDVNLRHFAKNTTEDFAVFPGGQIFTVGTAGIYLSNDLGLNFIQLSKNQFHAIKCSENRYCVAVGNGIIAKLELK
jgi:hypothetical protein